MAKRGSSTKGLEGYLFNFAAVGVGASTVLLAIFGMPAKEVAAICSERYGIATQFSLQRSAGEPASAVELQARLGGRDWGIVENASVVKTPNGPAALALQVNMPKSTAASGPFGAGFTWLLADAKPAGAVCLSYQVMVPSDFEFGDGGLLPGVFGGATATAPKDGKDLVSSSFGTHLVWGKDGRLGMRVATASDTGAVEFKALGAEQQPVLATGRWVPIEQEIVLNADGQSNGLLRVWVDGQLKLESKTAWRASDKSLFQGIDVRAHHGRSGLETLRSPNATNIRLSPIEARWQ